ncbi:hypothetical protein [Chondrinema litorale]|uniref:hypothetical protein n=1 Tax=Chondrinema litorale TaxID=2994555 RepID=UPI00254320AD|nr:hypothetical protein [Chondrinema litorale]UZR99497.1 hypothetical protein OQ292_36510 [Chondrinema litorale]
MKQSKFVNKVNCNSSFCLWVLLSLLLFSSKLIAQNQSSVQAYEQAQFDYQNGKVFKVLKLENHIDNLPNYLRDDAYYLLFSSYVQTQQDSMAYASMQKLLQENPDIDPTNEDEKFRYYYQMFRATPREIGVTVGQNLHKAKTNVSKNNKGFSIALVHNQYLNQRLILFKNLIYTERHQTLRLRTGKYNIPGTYIGQDNIDQTLADTYGVAAKNYPTDIYHLSGDTYPTFLEFASGIQWNIISKNRFQLFIKGGLAVNYLIENTFDNGEIYEWQIEYTDNNGQLEPSFPLESPTSVAEAQDAEHAKLFNIHYLAGAGIRYKINDGVIFLEGRWQQSILPQEVTFSSDSDNFDEILNQFNKQTLTFQTRTLTFSFGYLFSIQHFSKLKK